ncbi:MAG TPA: hypothetical protein VHE08_02450, partial [Solirubrobacterales bacterium]|nr:hypothetical protein [Solirubrobacterales bacterium]
MGIEDDLEPRPVHRQPGQLGGDPLLERRRGGLAAIEERLEAIDRLERKHGGSVESVLAHAERCRAEIERLEGASERGAEAT